MSSLSMAVGKMILFDPSLVMHKLYTLSHPHSALNIVYYDNRLYRECRGILTDTGPHSSMEVHMEEMKLRITNED